jgi:hypothetical protein
MFYSVNNISLASSLANIHYHDEVQIDFIAYFYNNDPLAREYFKQEFKSLNKTKIEITQYGGT